MTLNIVIILLTKELRPEYLQGHLGNLRTVVQSGFSTRDKMPRWGAHVSGIKIIFRSFSFFLQVLR